MATFIGLIMNSKCQQTLIENENSDTKNSDLFIYKIHPKVFLKNFNRHKMSLKKYLIQLEQF